MALIAAILCAFMFWKAFIFYKIPPQENFIGMTREQVAEWADKNGRLTYLDECHPNYRTIEIRTGPLHLYFNNKNDILNDEYVMKEPIWDIGWTKIRSDIRFAWRLKFENDVVVENSNTMVFDGP